MEGKGAGGGMECMRKLYKRGEDPSEDEARA